MVPFYQAYINIEKERAEGERERRRREISEKDKLLKNRALQINSLQGTTCGTTGYLQ